MAQDFPPPEERTALYFDVGRHSRDGVEQQVESIVIHWIVGTLASADSWFTDPASFVSAHYGIGEGRAFRWVSEDDTAWHAGDYLTNTRSIGIEHSAAPDRDPDEWTYDRTIALCADLCVRHGLVPREAIIRHREVVHDGQPVATVCPGPVPDSPSMVDVERIVAGVEAALAAPRTRPRHSGGRGPDPGPQRSIHEPASARGRKPKRS